MTPTNLLCLYDPNASAHLHALKKLILKAVGANAHLYKFIFAKTTGISQETFRQLCAAHDRVLLSCPRIAEEFLLKSLDNALTSQEKLSINSAAGSTYVVGGTRVLVLPELEQLHTVAEAPYLFERYLSKIFTPNKWIDFPKFTWERLDKQETFDAFLAEASTAKLMSCDIETSREAQGISCIGFSILTREGFIFTGVLDVRDDHYFHRIRQLLSLPVPKIFQNGLYDTQYLLHWNSPPTNWIWDTSYAFHSWLAELPKDLGALAAFFMLDFQYWKTDGRNAASLEEYHRYNAKDCYATLCIAIAQLREMPEWARINFVINFPRVFPCLLMNLQGLAVNEPRRQASYDFAKKSLEASQISLEKMTAIPDFNANSYKQVKNILECFGLGDWSTDEKSLLKAATKHPILGRILYKVLDYRGDAKAVSQYFNPKLLHGRLYFNFNPAGTVSGRFACQKSAFWCGAQIQNYPAYAKGYIEAEPGYVFVEIDNEQSETRCTGYMSQDENLILTVESGKDFHSMNATVFFGVPYDVAKKKTAEGEDSPPRKLAKKINHAVSYNMEDAMFVEQAGDRVMEMARDLLRLPKEWTLRHIAKHLISIFDRNYPKVRGDFQNEVKRNIAFSKMLTSPVFAKIVVRGKEIALKWTRRFFGNPSINKLDLNAAVAHGPQNLSVEIVNEGMLDVYQNFLFLPGRPIWLSAQVHDSLLFQIKEAEVDMWLPKLQATLRREVTIHGRVLVIPTAAKKTGKYWGKQQVPVETVSEVAA